MRSNDSPLSGVWELSSSKFNLPTKRHFVHLTVTRSGFAPQVGRCLAIQATCASIVAFSQYGVTGADALIVG